MAEAETVQHATGEVLCIASLFICTCIGLKLSTGNIGKILVNSLVVELLF